MDLQEIKKTIVPNKYTCDYCGKDGDITNTMYKSGYGIVHAKCYKKAI